MRLSAVWHGFAGQGFTFIEVLKLKKTMSLKLLAQHLIALEAFPTNTELSKCLKKGLSTTDENLDFLEKHGYVKSEMIGRSRFYFVIRKKIPSIIEEIEEEGASFEALANALHASFREG